MATRMKDIATALGLSIVTVSKVLNKKDANISAATRDRVLECARRMDYRTNLAAKGLVTGQSKMVGLIVPDLFHGFFAEVAAGMSDALAEQGYGLILSSSRGDEKLENREIKQMLARSVDALIVASCDSQAAGLKSADREVPVILLDRRMGDLTSLWFVGTEDSSAGKLATQHLVDIGRKRIAFIGSANFGPTSDREHAYRAVLAQAKLKMHPGYVVHLPTKEESNHVMGERSMRHLLKLKPRPDAVFCYNDPTAMGAMLAIFEMRLRIPEDIAVVGCGNSSYNAFLRVPLTSVDQDAAALGQEAANLTLRAIRERLHKKEHAPIAVLLKPTLVVRGSTAVIPGASDA
jgi:LacI family transcriptional regulator